MKKLIEIVKKVWGFIKAVNKWFFVGLCVGVAIGTALVVSIARKI